MFSANEAARDPPDAAAQPLRPGLEVVHALAEQQGERGAEEQVVEAAGGLLLDQAPFVRVHHRAALLFEDPAAAGVHHQEARVAEVAVVAPAGAVGLAVGAVGEVPQDRPGVVRAEDLGVEGIPLKLFR
jgi:hypothetical protein